MKSESENRNRLFTFSGGHSSSCIAALPRLLHTLIYYNSRQQWQYNFPAQYRKALVHNTRWLALYQRNMQLFSKQLCKMQAKEVLCNPLIQWVGQLCWLSSDQSQYMGIIKGKKQVQGHNVWWVVCKSTQTNSTCNWCLLSQSSQLSKWKMLTELGIFKLAVNLCH